MKYNEYRGVRKLVIAEITSDNGIYTTEEWEELAGVQSVAISKNETSEIHYYDNLAAIQVDSEGADEVTLVVSVVANKTRALIEGLSYDTANDLLIGTPKAKKFFALGFIGSKDDGTEEFNILYKGKFTGGNTTYNTKDDGTEGTNIEYTYTSIYTATKIYTSTGTTPDKCVKNIIVPASADVTEVDVFGTFSNGTSTIDVLTPDEIKAL